jgi:hypothetical protein
VTDAKDTTSDEHECFSHCGVEAFAEDRDDQPLVQFGWITDSLPRAKVRSAIGRGRYFHGSNTGATSSRITTTPSK